MSKRNIHIDNLQIRLPRGASNWARRIAGGLGNEILRSVAEAAQGRSGTERIKEINVAGKIKGNTFANPESLQKEIAGRVAAELAKKIL